MSLKKDKQKVLGEVFDDDRIRTFFDFEAPAGIDADFYVLEKAYRGMKSENFATFLDMFVADGRNINAVNGEGDSLLQLIAEHKQSAEYISSLKAHGAA
ncbi:PA4642 family protein [Pseudoteredinibacter isoporae]|uniref:PA4642 family protein n=1 Tax=Pseudoteredinibacter isoporae TaxID=570281 RepID=UPI003103115C